MSTKLKVCAYYPGCTAEGGNTDNVTTLLAQVEEAFKKATEESATEEEGVLSIFLASEWSFRKPNVGRVRQYFSSAQIVNICEGLKDISTLSPETLMFAGSILWSVPFKDPTTKKSMDLVFNTAPVLHNGKIIHMVHKSREGLDVSVGIDTEQVFALDFKDVHKEREGLLDFLGKNKQMIEDSDEGFLVNTFIHNGVKFGLEVCADHSDATLKNQTGPNKVDVHVVVSCGMSLSPSKVAFRDGGIALACDASSKATIEYPDTPKKTAFSFYQNERLTRNLENKSFFTSDNFPGFVLTYDNFLTLSTASLMSVDIDSQMDIDYYFRKLMEAFDRQSEEIKDLKDEVKKLRRVAGVKNQNTAGSRVAGVKKRNTADKRGARANPHALYWI